MPKITLHGHSCLTIADQDINVLVDPGSLSKLDDVGRPDVILITHSHADHADARYLAQSSAQIHAPSDAIEALRAEGITDDRLHVVDDGAELTLGSLLVQASVGSHAAIYPGVPTPLNASFLLDGRVLIPGDGYPRLGEPDKVEVLLVPVAGPWHKLSEAVDFARWYPAARAIPIHDALLSAPGIALSDRLMTSLVGDRYTRVRPETDFEL